MPGPNGDGRVENPERNPLDNPLGVRPDPSVRSMRSGEQNIYESGQVLQMIRQAGLSDTSAKLLQEHRHNDGPGTPGSGNPFANARMELRRHAEHKSETARENSRSKARDEEATSILKSRRH